MTRSFSSVLLLLAVSSGSCQSGGPIKFRGRDVEYAEGLSIKEKKSEGLILIVHGSHRFGIALPYAEDWEFETSAERPLHGHSRQQDLVATIQAGKRSAPLEEAEYLRDRMARLRTALSPGLDLRNDEIRRVGEHSVLEYRSDLRGSSTTPPQWHFWAVRQDETGTVYEAHFSTTHQEGPKGTEMRIEMHVILAVEFQILPRR